MDDKLYQTYFQVEKTHWWCVGRRKLVRQILDKWGKKNASVLDIGCNSGVLVSELQSAGYDAYGADQSAEAIEYGKKKGINNLMTCPVEELDKSLDRQFDIITCLDVLEHIKDDGAALGTIDRLLKPGGVAIIMAPAFQVLWNQNDIVSRHFRRYTLPGIIKKIAADTAWQIEKKTYFNTILFLPILALRKFLPWFQKKNQSDLELNNRFINSFFKASFSLEVSLLKIMSFPFGVSLCIVAKK